MRGTITHRKQAERYSKYSTCKGSQGCVGYIKKVNSGKGISDLSGLEYCRNLTIIDLEANQVVDLSQLTAISYLNLSDNNITDISALSNLTDSLA